jgi:hypothetical protein
VRGEPRQTPAPTRWLFSGQKCSSSSPCARRSARASDPNGVGIGTDRLHRMRGCQPAPGRKREPTRPRRASATAQHRIGAPFSCCCPSKPVLPRFLPPPDPGSCLFLPPTTRAGAIWCEKTKLTRAGSRSLSLSPRLSFTPFSTFSRLVKIASIPRPAWNFPDRRCRRFE